MDRYTSMIRNVQRPHCSPASSTLDVRRRRSDASCRRCRCITGCVRCCWDFTLLDLGADTNDTNAFLRCCEVQEARLLIFLLTQKSFFCAENDRQTLSRAGSHEHVRHCVFPQLVYLQKLLFFDKLACNH